MMIMMNRSAVAQTDDGSKSRKIKAIPAGGLVLGLGATFTLAAWNDSGFAQGTFAAGTFNMVGSTNGTDYAEHATVDAPATLALTVNPTLLSPGDVVYAPFAVKLDATTTHDAVVTISNAATTGAVTNLTYTLIQPTVFGCTSGTTGTELVAAATTFNLGPHHRGRPGVPVLQGDGGCPHRSGSDRYGDAGIHRSLTVRL